MNPSVARRSKKLDEDLEAYVHRLESVSWKVIRNAVLIAGGLLGIDAYFKGGPPSIVGWLAVVVVAGVVLPLNRLVRILAQGQRMWALGEQERRTSAPPESPPPRQRTGRQRQIGEGRSQARLTPVPQDPPKEASRS